MATNKKRIGKYIIYMSSELGKGAFAEVYRGMEEETKEEVAVKIVSKLKIEEDEYTKNAFYSEIQIMRRLKSKNIIQFMDVHESKNNFYIILELAQGGTLRSLLQKVGRLDQRTALKYLVQLLNGFGELVTSGVIHRDLKPDNILIKDDRLKIGDFGFAKHTANNSLMKTIVGTPAYMAPQILKAQQYSYKCDIWALGVILYEFVVGKIPWTFKEKTLDGIDREVRSHKIDFPPELEISDHMKDLIKGCLCIEENNRLDWEQIFHHPLFGGKFKSSFENKKEGSTKIGFIISNLRMIIHSNNLNLTKILSKVNSEYLQRNEFVNLMKFLDRNITEEEINIVYVHVEQKQKVFLNTFQEFLKKYGCRMTGIDLGLAEKAYASENEGFEETHSPEGQHLFLIIDQIKKKIDSQGLNLYKHFNDNEKECRNRDIELPSFANLVLQVDSALTKMQIETLFNEIDFKKCHKLTFYEYCAAMCKIGEIVYTPMEIE